MYLQSPRATYSSDNGSEHSPGQLSVIVATDTDLSVSVHREEDVKMPQEQPYAIPEQKQIHVYSEEPIQNEQIVEKPVEEPPQPAELSKEVKLIRFNVPYIQGEIQSLTPRKNWELRVANLESLLEVERNKNNELNKLLLTKDIELTSTKAECEASLHNMQNEVALTKARQESFKAQIEMLEKEKGQQAEDMTETINQCRSEIKSLEAQIKWHEGKEKEISIENLKKSGEIQDLTLKNSRLTAKVEESEIAANRAKKHYEEIIARIVEEKKAAAEAADAQTAKLVQALKENEGNFAKYQRFSTEANELKEKMRKMEDAVGKLQEENNELKVKLGIHENSPKLYEIRHVESETKVKREERPVMVEAKPEETSLKNQRELVEIKENVAKIENERDASLKERVALEQEVAKERVNSTNLLKDFQEYKRKVQGELDESDRLMKQLQKQVWAKDTEISELRTQLESLKEDSWRYKEVRSINSYLRNLPSTGLWMDDASIQKEVYEATKEAIEVAGQEKAKRTISKLNEEIEQLHGQNKRTFKKLYKEKADEMIRKNEDETEVYFEGMESRFDANLSHGKTFKTYLTEFKQYHQLCSSPSLFSSISYSFSPSAEAAFFF
eukprot:TRINITY_DN88391_c0_g1_i1.p1 TRINITY_DN88391_c0_g1~~TRINITY_DN88391_c0_g1_i1.p1  ORF type:complete len:613 (-),score=125.72 TRINITY_DN88391_c0_g1_i1:809-2647(-)